MRDALPPATTLVRTPLYLTQIFRRYNCRFQQEWRPSQFNQRWTFWFTMKAYNESEAPQVYRHNLASLFMVSYHDDSDNCPQLKRINVCGIRMQWYDRGHISRALCDAIAEPDDTSRLSSRVLDTPKLANFILARPHNNAHMPHCC